MTEIKPVVSIIVTSFNYALYIGATIESVLAQTFQNWELLIVDDCSTDNSWSIIQQFDDPRIRTHRQAVNLGACAAYNQALAMAQGDFIASLDSDDRFLPTKLERQLAFFAAQPEVDICGTFVTEIDCNGVVATGATPFADWFNASADLNDPARWLWENRLCHSGAVVRTELHRRLGEFDNTLIYTPDWQFWIRALATGARFAVIDEALVGYRNHGINITHKNPDGTLLEHAATTSRILLPWLQELGRQDLIEQTIRGFISHPALLSGSELQTEVAKHLFSGKAAVEAGTAVMRLEMQRLDEVRAKEAQLLEVLSGKEWLELEWKSGQAQLLAKEAHMVEVLAGKEQLELEWESGQAQLLAKGEQLDDVLDKIHFLESNSLLVSAVVTFHAEGLLAHKTLLGLERIRIFSEKRGISVELVAVLDYADTETIRVVKSSPVIRANDKVIEVSNGDPGISRNSGIEVAIGKYIAIFDGDDFYSENWICKALAVSLSKAEPVVVHPEHTISFGSIHAVSDVWDMDDRNDYSLVNAFAIHPWISCSFGEKKIYLQCPYQRAETKTTGFGYEDWHWNIELISKGIVHVTAKETALYYRTKRESRFTDQSGGRSILRPSEFFNHPQNWLKFPKKTI
jgi:glycosyltransferase involved in cell wall biosynthesis